MAIKPPVKKIIAIVRENKKSRRKQRRVTIPKEDKTLKHGDVVRIIKIEDQENE